MGRNGRELFSAVAQETSSHKVDKLFFNITVDEKQNETVGSFNNVLHNCTRQMNSCRTGDMFSK